MKLVDVRIKYLRIDSRGRVSFAERGHVAVPHQLRLRVFAQSVIEKGAEAGAAVRAQPVHRERVRDGNRPARFKTNEWRHFPFFPSLLALRRSPSSPPHPSP